MSVHLAVIGNAFQFFNTNGRPLAAGLLYTYAAGTTTPQTTYSDSVGAVPNANPIVLGADGRVPNEIWLTDAVAYKFVLKTSGGSTLGTYDNLTGIGDPSLGPNLAASGGSALVGFLQAGSGAVARTLQSKNRELFAVTDFGAVGNGSADDNTKIQNAATAAGAAASGTSLSNVKRITLWFPPGYTFISSTGITVGENVDVIMESPLFISGAAGLAIAGLTIGGANMTRHGHYVIDVRRQTQSDWSSTSDVGVTLKNIATSDIELRRTQGWCVGAQGLGANNGFTLNRVRIGELRGSKYGLMLTNTGTGYCNGNNVFGGEIAVASGEGVNTQSRYGIYFTGVNGNNTNQFYGTSCELALSLATPGEAIPVLIDNPSSLNRGYSIRSEGNSDTLLKITGDAGHNFFESSFSARQGAWPSVSAAGISDTSKWQTNDVYSYVQDLMAKSYQVFDSGPLGRATNQYDGATQYTVDGFDISDSSFNLFAGQTLIAPTNDDVVTFSIGGRNLTRFIDTRVNKRFIVFFDTGSVSQNTNFSIKPYDSAGALLADNPTPAHVYGEDVNVFAWSAGTVGGSYSSTGVNTYAFVYFTVDSLTKSVAFNYMSNNGQVLRSLRIYALDFPCTSWQTKREREFNGRMIATAIPNADSWTQGDRVYNHTPAAAGTEGWVCVTSGTFGALAGCTATTTSGSQSFTVNSATNLQIGMYITIAGVAGVKRIIGLNGTNATMDTAAGATVAAAAAAYQAPTFKTFGTIAA